MILNKLFKPEKKIIWFSLILSCINFIFYNIPFVNYVTENIDLNNFSGILLLCSLILVLIILTALIFYIFLYTMRIIGKSLIIVFFMINSVALYFMNTFGVIIDKSMIANIFNTKFDESSSFLSLTMVFYIIFLGILPCIYIYKTKVVYASIKRTVAHILSTLVFLISFAYINSSNWLWIDKYVPTFGAIVMPWSYVANTSRYYSQKIKENKKQIILPNITIKDNSKSVVILVIGESARLQNFSLYGYSKNTNPLLSKIENLAKFKTESCATNTMSGVKCILEHKYTSDLYEPLPNYLHRNGIDVIWRTTNWGEPTIKIDKYLKSEELKKNCSGDDCNYDGVLLTGLKEEIEACTKDKILIVLHTSTSHGPSYNKKYPEKFNKFTPVCKNVELKKCTDSELMNAYDNTIVYTDYLLTEIIKTLKELPDYKSSMLYISDHGESLGEKNLYMHGLPKGIAPKEQYEIPFIVWTSENTKTIKNIDNDILSQHHVFHSVMDFLDITSEIYDEEKSIFE